MHATSKSIALGLFIYLSVGAILPQVEGDPSLLCPNPTPCLPNGSNNPPVGSSDCAVLTVEPLVSSIGYGSDGCTPTCRPCKQDLRISVDCTGCTNGCTYVWVNNSFDTDGSAMTPQVGTGTTNQTASFRTTVSSNCAGETAIAGVSAAGLQVSYSMHCDCP